MPWPPRVASFGNEIKVITLDGQPLAGAAVPASLTGHHQVLIELSGQAPAAAPVNRVANLFGPETPEASYRDGQWRWLAVPGAVRYRELWNGVTQQTTPGPDLRSRPRHPDRVSGSSAGRVRAGVVCQRAAGGAARNPGHAGCLPLPGFHRRGLR